MASFPAVLGDGFGCSVVLLTKARQYAVLEFTFVAAYKLSDVSDEIIEGHPLTGKGLTAYRTFVVKNSSWIAELEAIDRVHPQHSAERWRASQHYLLCFKDRMFEAIARDTRVTGIFSTAEEAVRHAAARLKSDA